MECSGFDWKGYALGELSATEAAQCDRHVLSCERCRTESARYRATVAGLNTLPLLEPPRRIVFVPEPVVRGASRWSRVWQSGPQLGFASVAVLALAILVHGLLARIPAPAPSAQIAVLVQAEAQKEVARRLPQAVDAAIRTTLQTRLQEEIRPAVAGLERQLSQQEQLRTAGFEQRRDADQRAVRYAFEKLERKINYAMLSSVRPQGGE